MLSYKNLQHNLGKNKVTSSPDNLRIAVDQTISSLRAMSEVLPTLEDNRALKVIHEMGKIAACTLVLQEMCDQTNDSPIAIRALEVAEVASPPETEATEESQSQTIEVLGQVGVGATVESPVSQIVKKSRTRQERDSVEVYTQREKSVLEYLEQHPGQHFKPSELIQILINDGHASTTSAAAQLTRRLWQKIASDPMYKDRFYQEGKTVGRRVWLDAASEPIAEHEMTQKIFSPADMAITTRPLTVSAVESEVEPSYTSRTVDTVAINELRLIENGHLELYYGDKRLKLGGNALAVLKKLTDMKQPVSFIELSDLVADVHKSKGRTQLHTQILNVAIDQINELFRELKLPALLDSVDNYVRKISLPFPLYFEVAEKSEGTADFLAR